MTDYKNWYDMIIIGAGPAGLSAAIYMARAKYKVLVLEKDKVGGQITITDEVVNYPGVKKASGKEIVDNMWQQAESFGAELALAEVKDMELEGDIKKIHTTKGTYETLSVVLALGANPRKLGFKGEKEFTGRGVAYCATCDGEFFTGMNVFVLGGGFAAVEEGLFLTKYAKQVKLMVREPDFTCAKTVSDKLNGVKNIHATFYTELEELTGDTTLEKAIFKNNQTGEITVYDAKQEGPFGVFVFAGYIPNTGWLPKVVELNNQGYLKTDVNQQTNLVGVYGAGDVCEKDLRQVVTAVSDGAIAATSAEKYVAELHEKLNLPEFRIEKPAISEEKETAKNQETKMQGSTGTFFDAQMRAQLGAVFAKFNAPVVLKAWLDHSSLSTEITGFLDEVVSISDKVTWIKGEGEGPALKPSIEICKEDGSSSQIHFHGVPGGHEINSFIIAMYNVAGPGKEIDSVLEQKIRDISTDINIKVLVSLSCTMCPETVMSAQKIASLSKHVQAEMIDLTHFPELKEKYKVMSVPCVVVNDSELSFGKKNIEEMLEIIQA